MAANKKKEKKRIYTKIQRRSRRKAYNTNNLHLNMVNGSVPNVNLSTVALFVFSCLLVLTSPSLA